MHVIITSEMDHTRTIASDARAAQASLGLNNILVLGALRPHIPGKAVVLGRKFSMLFNLLHQNAPVPKSISDYGSRFPQDSLKIRFPWTWLVKSSLSCRWGVNKEYGPLRFALRVCLWQKPAILLFTVVSFVNCMISKTTCDSPKEKTHFWTQMSNYTRPQCTVMECWSFLVAHDAKSVRSGYARSSTKEETETSPIDEMCSDIFHEWQIGMHDAKHGQRRRANKMYPSPAKVDHTSWINRHCFGKRSAQDWFWQI